jgi:hypothetical protein
MRPSNASYRPKITWNVCIIPKRSVFWPSKSPSFVKIPLAYLQIARANAVKAEFIKKAEHQATEGRKVADVLADGVIVGVGLIQRDKGGQDK